MENTWNLSQWKSIEASYHSLLQVLHHQMSVDIISHMTGHMTSVTWLMTSSVYDIINGIIMQWHWWHQRVCVWLNAKFEANGTKLTVISGGWLYHGCTTCFTCSIMTNEINQQMAALTCYHSDQSKILTRPQWHLMDGCTMVVPHAPSWQMKQINRWQH